MPCDCGNWDAVIVGMRIRIAPGKGRPASNIYREDKVKLVFPCLLITEGGIVISRHEIDAFNAIDAESA